MEDSYLLDMISKLEDNQKLMADYLDAIVQYLVRKGEDDTFILSQLFECRGIDWKTKNSKDLNYIRHRLNVVDEKVDSLQGEIIYKFNKLVESRKTNDELKSSGRL